MSSFFSFYRFPPHVILDSRFSEQSFLDWIEVNQFGATFALPCTHMSHLFTLLSEDVGIGEWRAAYTSMGRVASFKRVQSANGSIVEWRVLSSGWHVSNQTFTNDDSFTIDDYNLLLKLSPKALISIAKGMGVTDIGDKQKITTAITNLTPEQRVVIEKGLESSVRRAEKCM